MSFLSVTIGFRFNNDPKVVAVLLKEENVFFNTSRDKKIELIHKFKCNYFIDDLPDILDSLSNDIKKLTIDTSIIDTKDFYNFLNVSAVHQGLALEVDPLKREDISDIFFLLIMFFM